MPSLEEIKQKRQSSSNAKFKRKQRRPWDISGSGQLEEGAKYEEQPHKSESKQDKEITNLEDSADNSYVARGLHTSVASSVIQKKEKGIQKQISHSKNKSYENNKPPVIPTKNEKQFLLDDTESVELKESKSINSDNFAKEQFDKITTKPVQAIEYRIRSLRGVKKKLLKIIVNSCMENSSMITPPLFMEDFIQMTGKNKEILKSRLAELKKTDLIITHSKRGVGGYYQFEVDQVVINAVKKYF